MPDTIHPFWGHIIETPANDYATGIRFSHPFFGDKAFPVYLGDHHTRHLQMDREMLDGFADTYLDFIENIEKRLETLQEGFYHFFEQHLAEMLPVIFEEYPAITSKEVHNAYIKSLAEIRLFEEARLQLTFYYGLYPAPVFRVDFEHGILMPLG